MQENENVRSVNDRLAYFEQFIGKNSSGSFSPVGKWLKGTLLRVSLKGVAVEFTVRTEMTNPMGIMHGGIAATILDEVCGISVLALGREFAYTSINLNCDYLHFAKLGETVIAEAWIIRAGKNVVHVEGHIKDQAGKIIAKCASNLIQTSLKIPAFLG